MKIKMLAALASSRDVLDSKESDIAIAEFGSIHYGPQEFECFLLVREDDAEAANVIAESLFDFDVVEVIKWDWERQRCFTVKEPASVVLGALNAIISKKCREQCPI